MSKRSPFLECEAFESDHVHLLEGVEPKLMNFIHYS